MSMANIHTYTGRLKTRIHKGNIYKLRYVIDNMSWLTRPRSEIKKAMSMVGSGGLSTSGAGSDIQKWLKKKRIKGLPSTIGITLVWEKTKHTRRKLTGLQHSQVRKARKRLSH